MYTQPMRLNLLFRSLRVVCVDRTAQIQQEYISIKKEEEEEERKKTSNDNYMRGGYHVLSRIKQLLLTTDGLRNYSRYLKHNKDLD